MLLIATLPLLSCAADRDETALLWPPLGALRFRAPQPAIPWSNPHDRRHRDPRRPLRQAPARRHRAV